MSNASCDTSHFRYPLFTATYSLVLALGLPLNAASLWTFVRRLGLQSVPVIYMANLALSDLLFTLSLPLRIFYFATAWWPFGDVACMIPGTMFSVNLYSSSLFIAFISVDRLLAVVYPLRSRTLRTPLLAWLSCAGVWLAILGLAVPVALNHRTNVDKGCNVTRCFEHYSSREWRQGFYILCAVTALGILLPFTVITASTVSVIRKLRTGRVSPAVDKRKMIWMFLTNLLIYAVCFIPFHVAFILYGLYKLEFLQSSYFDAQTVTMCLASTNSCLDPIIYYFSIKNLRRNSDVDTMSMGAALNE
ncbi:lysophosphatidic acid receptor 5a [Megalops cyprinoides]|uniref:lysophosphatidic acid receptor 5a n=1 Tax=Megalops cyprinoides TaxID=118141 RepID=UPI001863A8EB|nr:lysophosphatidic acid receptor 5a [Megalops cyprinoides]